MLAGVGKTVNPPYAASIRRIIFCMLFKLAGGEGFVKTACGWQIHIR